MGLEKTVNKNSALWVTTLSAFLTPFMGSAVNIALPSIGREFNLNAILLSWVQTSYILAAAIFLVPFGRLADLHGRKRTFLYGISIYTASSLILGFSNSAVVLISFRVWQGIGGAMIFGTSAAILTSVFPVGERGRALGINVAMVYLGLSLGPVAGGFLTQQMGWRSIFFANVPIGLAIMAVTVWKLKTEWAEAKGERFDWIGSVFYSLALVAVMLGFSLLPGWPGAGLLVLGGLGLVLFIRWEIRAAYPVLNIALFRKNSVFAFSNLAALINYSATFAVGFILSLYLQYIKGLSPQAAGLILLAQPAMQALFSPLAGRLSDRIEPRLMASLGMALTVVGLIFLVSLREQTPPGIIVASLVILGFSFALFASPNTNAVMSSVEKKFYGVASATLGTMRLTGQMLSMGLATLIFALNLGRVKITPENHLLFLHSAKTAFLLFAGLCFAGIFASLARGKMHDLGQAPFSK